MRDLLTTYRLLLRLVLGRGRLVALLLLGLLGILIGVAVRNADVDGVERTEGIARLLVGGYGMNLVVPVTALVFASAVLGDLAEDKTLVHLWLTPLPRWRVTAAAAMASLTVVVPLSVVPLVAAVAVAGGPADLVGATAIGALLAVGGFTSLFLGLGLVVRRALAWGGAYLLIWELAVARLAEGAARLSVSVHARSVIANLGDVPPPPNASSTALALGVLAAVIVGALGLTTFALRRIDVA